MKLSQIILITFLVSLLPVLHAQNFDQQTDQFKKNPSQQNLTNVIKILDEGYKQKRAAKALATVRIWMQNNRKEDAILFFRLGRAYHQAGQWPDAVRFYKRYLATKNLNKAMADESVSSLYQLMVSNLDDANQAYNYMQSHGLKLRAYGKAKKYDEWFMTQAYNRKDMLGYSDYLEVLYREKSKLDLDVYFQKLLINLENMNRYEPATYASVEKLSRLPQLKKYQAHLNWAVQAMRYNLEHEPQINNPKPVLDENKTKALLAAAQKRVEADKMTGPFAVIKGLYPLFIHHHAHRMKLLGFHGEEKQKYLLSMIKTLNEKELNHLYRLSYAASRHHVVTANHVLATKTNRQIVKHFPKFFNNHFAPAINLIDKTITHEEAKAIAPHLRANIHMDAGVVRAIAAGGLSFPKAADALAKNEMWRYWRVHEPLKRLWDHGPRRDGDYNKIAKKYKSAELKNNAKSQAMMKKCGNGASRKDRMGVFQQVVKDMFGPTPTIQGAKNILIEAVNHGSNEEIDEIMHTLYSMNGDTQPLVVELMRNAKVKYEGKKKKDKGIYGPHNHDMPHGGRWAVYYRKVFVKTKVALKKRIDQEIAKGNLPQIMLAMWMNMVEYKDPEVQKFLRKIVDGPLKKQLDRYHIRNYVYSQHHFHVLPTKDDSKFLSRELKNLQRGALPPEVFKAFNTVLNRYAKRGSKEMPTHITPFVSVHQFDANAKKDALRLFSDLAPQGKYLRGQWYEQLTNRLIDEFTKAKQFEEATKYTNRFWHCYHSTGNDSIAQKLAELAEAAINDEKYSVAATIASEGLNSKAKNKPLLMLKGALAKANAKLGLVDILVDKGDSAYNIFKSQAEYIQGNETSAWSLYDASSEKMLPVVRKLNPDFSFWILETCLKRGFIERAKEIGKEMYIWSFKEKGSLDETQDARLKIAMGDIAFADGNFARSKSQYNKIISSRSYRGSEQQFQAQLGVIKVDMATKDFSSALTVLENLVKDPIKDRRYHAHYIRARVYYEQGNYGEARKDISVVLKGDSDYELRAESMILKGDLEVKDRNFEGGEELEVGNRDSRTTVVPGEPLTIKLHDQSLSVSGDSSNIEVEVWAKSGDRERIFLRAEGDDKTKFKGKIITELGAPKLNDKVLQILGVDEIRYDYSKRFRQKMKDLPKANGIVMVVKSNASIAMSAGAFPQRKGERRLDIDSLGLSSSQKALGTRRVRPGNPLYIRVIDHDHSKTSQVDEVSVKVETSSGDRIGHVILKETGRYTGEFEGIVKTATAITTASASDTEKGLDPNNAISPKRDGVWKGDKSFDMKKKKRFYKVDFNDKVSLSQLSIEGQEGNGLTKFLVQTSTEGSEWTTVATYPESPTAWNGQAEMMMAHDPTHGKLNRELAEWRELVKLAPLMSRVNVPKVKTLQEYKGHPPGHPNHHFFVRFRARFFQSALGERTFKLHGYPMSDKGVNTYLVLDGKISEDEDDPLTITRELKPGIHTVEVWRLDNFQNYKKLKPVLLCDNPETGELAPCSESMFDPKTFPPLIQKELREKGKVKNKGKGNYEVQFGKNTIGRMLRLRILAHEGEVPILKHLSMKDAEGKQRLPTESDYRELRVNNILEVLPGDSVSVLYEDDNFIGMNRNKKVDRKGDVVKVAFNNATIGASFLTYINTDAGRKLHLEDIRRFKMGSDIAFIIKDMDMDGSPKRDVINFKVKTSHGFTRELKAIESGEHTGTFIGRFYPVMRKAEREAEIEIKHGETITAYYLDAENEQPGIPVERTVMIEHAKYVQPEFSVFSVSSEAKEIIQEEASSEAQKKNKKGSSNPREKKPERYPVKRVMNVTELRSEDLKTQTPTTLLNSSIRFNIKAPHLALAKSSTIHAYVQTESGRKIHKGKAPEGMPFDINVPGTMKIETGPSYSNAMGVPLGYESSNSSLKGRSKSKSKGGSSGSALDKGLFSFSLPLHLGEVPLESFATQEALNTRGVAKPKSLAVMPGDIIYVAYPYFKEDDFYNPKKANRKVHWFTAKYKLESHVFLDMMEGQFHDPLTKAFVGEKVYLRLIASGLDKGNGLDEVKVWIKSKSGKSSTFTLTETEQHSGIFKGIFKLTYLTESTKALKELPPVELNGFPVLYNDIIAVGFRNSGDPKPIQLRVSKGANGLIKPFSKRFSDSGVAVKTSFTMAECFFELAMQHKKMEQESLARREMKHAEKLLLEAIASHRDEDQQAHAEYLLGNLAQEYAAISKNDQSKKSNYGNALNRYKKVVLEYPDADYAAKAQYKIAFVYDKMDAMQGMSTMEQAVEEYVKLAYKYPENELIPKVMTRIGSYFQKKGKTYKDEAQAKDEKKEGDGADLMRHARFEFLRAANVFHKLHIRFPEDPLSPLAGLRAAQNYMRADTFDKAIDLFQIVIDNEDLDGETIRAQAMYWQGFCIEKLAVKKGSEKKDAYQLYNRIRYEFPSSQWAKYARGRLTDPSFDKIAKEEEARKERIRAALKAR